MIDTEDTSRVKISNDLLSTMSSKEFELLFNHMNERHDLNPNEIRALKKYRRMIRNREYASSSRAKKKLYLIEMKNQMQALIEENQQLKSRVIQLDKKIVKLEEELSKREGIE